MAITLGTNAGFCETAPSADPGGTNTGMDAQTMVGADTSPATAVRITEIGFWVHSAADVINFEVGVYDDNGTNADNLIHVSRTNDTTGGAGWQRVTGLNWAISSSTKYWLAHQIDDTATSTRVEFSGSGGQGRDSKNFGGSDTTLTDPHAGGGPDDADGITSLYCIWDTGEEAAVSVLQFQTDGLNFVVQPI